jgi:glycosyltransferase involved in cell wall biosynthesis
LLAARSLGSGDRTVLIPGVGVDLDQFAYTEIPINAPPVVLLPARLIRDKGIEEFVAAAAIVKRTNTAARFILVGAADPDNPAAFAPDEIDAWVQTGVVEWWGYRQDMAEVYRQATIVCLPSYREGLPKVLVEAAAIGRPLVAADVTGCRDICRDGINGTLVPVRNARALAEAVQRLLAAPSTCAAYGDAGRRIVEREYSVTHIARQTLGFYDQVCGRGEAD